MRSPHLPRGYGIKVAYCGLFIFSGSGGPHFNVYQSNIMYTCKLKQYLRIHIIFSSSEKRVKAIESVHTVFIDRILKLICSSYKHGDFLKKYWKCCKIIKCLIEIKNKTLINEKILFLHKSFQCFIRTLIYCMDLVFKPNIYPYKIISI